MTCVADKSKKVDIISRKAFKAGIERREVWFSHHNIAGVVGSNPNRVLFVLTVGINTSTTHFSKISFVTHPELL